MDGYEVARQVREGLGPDICLIAMTGFGQPHDRQKAVEAGFDGREDGLTRLGEPGVRQ